MQLASRGRVDVARLPRVVVVVVCIARDVRSATVKTVNATTVQFVHRRGLHEVRRCLTVTLPRVVDLAQLVGAPPALRQQLHGTREHDEVRQHLTDDEPRRRHRQARHVAVPDRVDAERTRVAQSVDADPLGGGCRLDVGVGPDDVDVEKTEDDEERGDDAVSARQLADRRQSLRTLVDARRLGGHHDRQPRAELHRQVRHVRVDLHHTSISCAVTCRSN